MPKYNFYAIDHKPNDNRFSERVDCENKRDVYYYYLQMKSLWKTEVNVFEANTNEQIFFEPIQEDNVDIIVRRYEWICKQCNTLNFEIECPPIVVCKNCNAIFDIDLPEHALG